MYGRQTKKLMKQHIKTVSRRQTSEDMFCYYCFIFCHNFDWAHRQHCKPDIHFSSWPNVPQFQRKVQQTIVLTTEPSVYTFLLLPFPFPLYMEMKRSFMLFPLVALFIAVWRFISWFHLRFRRLLLGKPLKCVSDSKQSFSRILSLVPVASSLMIKKKKRFSKRTELPSEAKIYSILSLGKEMLFLFHGWHERRTEDHLCH